MSDWQMLNAEPSGTLLADDFPVERIIESGSVLPRTRTAKRLGESALVLLLCVSVVAPAFWITHDLPKFRSETALLLAVAVGYGLMMLSGTVKTIRFHAFYLLGVLFSLSVSISLVYGTTFLGHPFNYRDLFEIAKCWLPVLFFSFAYETEISERGIARLLNYFAAATVVVCLLGWAQFLNLGIASQLQPYYGDGGHNDLGLLLYRRVYATMLNPNALGQFLSWTLIIYTTAFLFEVGNRLRNAGIALCCVTALTLTSSRYGLLAAAFGLVFVVGLTVRTRRGRGKLAVLLLLAVVFAGAFLVAQKSSYFAARRFDELASPAQISSVRERLDSLWLDAVAYIADSPVLGHGPAKNLFDEVFTDSEYLDILKCYGVIGFLIYSAYYFWPLSQVLKALKTMRFASADGERELRGNFLLMRSGFVILCMALFMNVGEFTYFNWVLTGFLWMWVGLSVRSARFVTELQAVIEHAVEEQHTSEEWASIPEPFVSPVLRTH